jgi:2-desacetyl-2-hydroxyethyl bacteriochlorophyllide A dehydrogenase
MANGDGWRVVVRANGVVETERYAIPQPGPRQVLIETECTAVSAGTELGVQEQTRAGDYHPGYSNVGRVIALGDGVRGVEVGTRVLSFGNHASHVLSGTDSPYLVPVPEGVASSDAAFAVIGSVSMHGARKARVELGEHVVITGAGIVGQILLQLLAKTGAETLTVVDLAPARLELALKHGATHVVDGNAPDVVGRLHDITRGRGVDVAVEASGYPAVVPALVEACRIGGRIVLLGSIWHRPLTIDLMSFHEKEITMMGCHQPKCPPTATSYYPWSQEYNRKTFLDWLVQGRIRLQSLITHELDPRDAADAYRLLRAERDRALGVVFRFKDASSSSATASSPLL